ncbi:hypothetical protein ACLVL9_08685 [Streptococcus pneumoniae]|uniref:hypothetical protein n=1 Tax=Streptococcus pneumoniae TaxID=1313 RepID=UPI0029D93E12|nr:hypothetical protein [Streptococcus pneumoniae]MDG7818480.1 hypothetical protein [Streptococcus pneumoniae]MDG8770933.1 hypothetical protein [Streptococcus pneumoniae]
MKIKEQTRKLAAGCSKHRFEVVDRTDEVSSKHGFEVVDRTDEVSNIYTPKSFIPLSTRCNLQNP